MGHSQYSGVMNNAPYNGGQQSGGATMYNGAPYNGAVTYTSANQQISATSYQPPSYAPGPTYDSQKFYDLMNFFASTFYL